MLRKFVFKLSYLISYYSLFRESGLFAQHVIPKTDAGRHLRPFQILGLRGPSRAKASGSESLIISQRDLIGNLSS